MLLPADDPERGMCGYLAFHMQDGEEQSEILEWPLFQGPLDPETAEVLPEELASFLASGTGPLALCDDPRMLRIGFVRYEPERGRSVVRRSRITLVKGATDEVRAAIWAHREALMAQSPPRQNELNP